MCQLVSEIYGIARSRQGTDARVEQIGRPSLVHRYHRNARGQGFENGEAKGLVPAGKGQDVGSGIEFRQALTVSAAGDDKFLAEARRLLEPYNSCGLCDPARRNMYPYTGSTPRAVCRS